jgi:GLPGLI family protein
MKKTLILLLFGLFFCLLKAQDTHRFPVKISYDMYLNFGDQVKYISSLFYSNDMAYFSYKTTNSFYTEEVENEDDSKLSFAIQDTTVQTLWISNITREIYDVSTALSKEKKLIVEPLDTIAWEIHDETKNIDHYICQKATCRYRGRNYIAWFTPDIPCMWGPWKLRGLPGAILEACDDRNEVSFHATGVMAQDTSIVVSTDRYEKISRQVYKKSVYEQGEKLAKMMGSRVGKGFSVSIAKPVIVGIELLDEE